MKLLLLVVVGLALFSTPAIASRKAQIITLSQSVTAGSVRLTPGEYKVTWTGAGPEVEVTLARDGKSPVTLEAKLVQKENMTPGVLLDQQGGSRVLNEIQLSHVSLVLAGRPAQKN